jgi:hypothetical protein
MLTKSDKKFLTETFVTKKDLKRIEKKLDTTIRFFDTTSVNHEKRIKRVEKHLDLPSLVD